MEAMKVRLAERLEDIRRAREAAARQIAESTGRALVILTKEQEVARRFEVYAAENGLLLTGGRRGGKARSGSAAAAGYAAGAGVNLGGGAISGGVRMIGR